MWRTARLGWGVLAIGASLLVAACGPAPNAEDARAAQGPPAYGAYVEQPAPAPPTVVVVQCTAGAGACLGAPPPPPPVVIVPAPGPAVAMAPPPPAMAPPPVLVPAPTPDTFVRATIERRMPKFRRCYDKGLSRNPRLQGTVYVQFEVDPDGEVDKALEHSSTLADRKTVDCVLNVAEHLDFKRNVGRRFVYPIHFYLGMGR